MRRKRISHTIQKKLRLLCWATLLLACCCSPHSAHGWKPRLFRGRKRGPSREDICEIDPFSKTSGNQMEGMEEPETSGGRRKRQEAALIGRLIARWLPEGQVQEWAWRINDIVTYEPPVGIVAVAVALRLVWTGRLFSFHSRKDAVSSAEGMLRNAEGRKKNRERGRGRPFLQRGRPFFLDPHDESYDTFGGVERIRRKLCWAALQGLDPTTQEDVTQSLALQAMQISHKAGAARAAFVKDITIPLSRLEQILASTRSTAKHKGSLRWETPVSDSQIILQVSCKSAEIRATDALLRVARDRLLLTCARLKRTLQHWKRRVKWRKRRAYLFGFLLNAVGSHEEGDQLRLAVIQAAYNAEVSHLGAVQRILVERPGELKDSDLLASLEETTSTDSEDNSSADKEQSAKKFFLPAISKYALRWNAGGGSLLTLKVYEGDGTIQPERAKEILLQHDPQAWIASAHDWTEEARRVVAQVVEGSLESTHGTDVADARRQLQGWCNLDPFDLEEDGWPTVIQLVDDLDGPRRAGEGKSISLQGGISFWTNQMDAFGIPSSLAAIGAAQVLHNHLLPYWPTFRKGVIELSSICWTIFEKRFWSPFSTIVMSLIAKQSSSLLDAFDVENEETSLDNMLYDLDLGDGTAASRRSALQGASRAYEDQLASGVLKSAIRGKLVRLLLIQVQQLKAGLLHALRSIDVLVDANKLNLQLLTAIPSVLIVVLGTRFFLRTLVTIRSRDLRPLEDVHAEMLQYLDDMEKSVLMARPHETTASNDKVLLDSCDLGEFVLSIHSYLVLLDCCAPPFPHRACDSIHVSLQELLSLQGSGKLDTSQQVALLHLLRAKHMDLLRFI